MFLGNKGENLDGNFKCGSPDDFKVHSLKQGGREFLIASKEKRFEMKQGAEKKLPISSMGK